MKFKKKTAMILSFAVGTMMFATTAFAEVASKSGYDQVKDSLKFTAENCTTKLSSYTADMSCVIKDNGKVIASHNTLNKYDVKNKSMENVAKNTDSKGKHETYYYADKNGFITKNDETDIYYATDYTSPKDVESFKNPFKEKQASDVEKIADALVGNLKDSVAVTQNTDGSKQISGSLNESQIPTLVNAVVSFQCKNIFGNRYNNETKNMPKITKDILVKEAKGNMVVGKDGLIQSVLSTGVITGKDENGEEHTLTFELLGKLSDVNSTTVNKPDLSGKKVEKRVQKDHNKLDNPEKFIGKYKTDILIEKDNKFEKAGERFVEIEQLDDKSIGGRYYEEFAKGYEEYASNKKDFKFTGKFEEKDHLGAEFTSDNKMNGHIYIDTFSGTIHFNINGINRETLMFNDGFNRMFN